MCILSGEKVIVLDYFNNVKRAKTLSTYYLSNIQIQTRQKVFCLMLIIS